MFMVFEVFNKHRIFCSFGQFHITAIITYLDWICHTILSDYDLVFSLNFQLSTQAYLVKKDYDRDGQSNETCLKTSQQVALSIRG